MVDVLRTSCFAGLLGSLFLCMPSPAVSQLSVDDLNSLIDSREEKLEQLKRIQVEISEKLRISDTVDSTASDTWRSISGKPPTLEAGSFPTFGDHSNIGLRAWIYKPEIMSLEQEQALSRVVSEIEGIDFNYKGISREIELFEIRESSKDGKINFFNSKDLVAEITVINQIDVTAAESIRDELIKNGVFTTIKTIPDGGYDWVSPGHLEIRLMSE